MSLYSPYWYRAAPLTPRLKRHCSIGRQVHRGRVWHVVANRATGEFFRITPTAHALVGLMDGRRTVERIWREAAGPLGDDLPTQEEVIQLLSRLHKADLLHSGVAPDVAELAERRDTRLRGKILRSIKNPFALRIPMWDPEAFLARWAPLANLIFTPAVALAYVALIAYAIVTLALEWPALANDVSSQLMATETLLLLVLVYPVVKAFHELGHGFAIKRWGGEVREMGVMLLFLMPVPYVDASAATSWPDKWRRVLVSSMGILVELAIAAVAVIVWANVEPGWVRSIAFATMATAGISTLVFNGNPLLRFDGYYALSDAIEIPNLAQRANKYVGYLVKRYAFGMSRERFPALSRGEPTWLTCYAVAAFLYRISIAIAIAILVSGWLFELGLLLALWSLTQMLLFPAGKALWYVFNNEALMKVRRRAVSTTLAGVAAVVAIIALVPLPYAQIAQGVVWAGEDATVVAKGGGFVVTAAVAPGEDVAAGAAIYVLQNERLETQRANAIAQVEGFRSALEARRAEGPAAAARAREQLTQAEATAARIEAQLRDLVVRSPAAGRFEPIDARDPIGRHIPQGDPVGFLVDPARPVRLRIVAHERDLDLIRDRRRAVEARFPHLPGQSFQARIVREVPAIDNALPHPALSTLGRGDFALDPSEPTTLRSLDSFGVFEAELVDGPPNLLVGAAADIRIDLGWAPLAIQLGRPLQQLLLKATAG